jgi:hypothetical protein
MKGSLRLFKIVKNNVEKHIPKQGDVQVDTGSSQTFIVT